MSDRIHVAVPAVVISLALCVSGATGAYAADATPADANPASDEGIAEVIVTSQRREESLSKVPISITAITSQDIDNKGIKDITDVARFTPGDEPVSIPIDGLPPAMVGLMVILAMIVVAFAGFWLLR